MKFSKIFNVAVIAATMTLGFASCSNEEVAENTSEQAQLTDAQKQAYITGALKSFDESTGKATIKSVEMSKEILGKMPEKGEGVDKIKELLGSLLDNLLGGKTDLSVIVRLGNIYGEYTYDGQNWTIVSLDQKNVLKINYVADGKSYSVTLQYSDRIKVTGPDFERQVTILGKTFNVATTVNMPSNVKFIFADETGEVLNGFVNVNLGEAGDNGVIVFDPRTSQYVVSVQVMHESLGGFTTVQKIKGEDVTTNLLLLSAEGDKLANILIETANGAAKLTATIPATDQTPELILRGEISDVKEFANCAIQILSQNTVNPQHAIDTMNELLGDGIVLSVVINDQEVEIGVVTLALATTEDGYVTIVPNVTINKDELVEIILEESPIFDIIMEIIQGIIGGVIPE